MTISAAQLSTLARVMGDTVDEAVASQTFGDGAMLAFGNSSDVVIGWNANGYPILGSGPSSAMDYGLPSMAHSLGHRWGTRDFDDFLPYNSDLWEEGYDSGGSVAAQDAQDGTILLTTNAAAGAHCQIKRPIEAFGLSANGRLMFDFGLKLSDATDTALLVGLAVRTADIIDDHVATTLQDGVFLYKATGSTDIKLVTLKDGTATTSAVVATATTSWMWLGFQHNGTSVQAFASGVGGPTNSTNLPDDELLAPHVAIDGNGKTCEIDFVNAHSLRSW